MTLVPYTGWRCLNCGHPTDRGFPILSCCSRAVPARAFIDEPDVTDDQLAVLTEARAGDIATDAPALIDPSTRRQEELA